MVLVKYRYYIRRDRLAAFVIPHFLNPHPPILSRVHPHAGTVLAIEDVDGEGAVQPNYLIILFSVFLHSCCELALDLVSNYHC